MSSWLDTVKVFSFDMGFTLFDYKGMSDKSLDVQRTLLFESLAKAGYEIINEEIFWKTYLKIAQNVYLTKIAKMKDSRYLYERLGETLAELDYHSPSTEELVQIAAPMLNYKYSFNNLIMENDVIELLEWLSNHNYKIMMISNFPERAGPGEPHFIEGLLHHYGIYHYFDQIIVSGEYEIAKPNPELFQLAIDQAGVHPSEIVHVGDDYLADVEGAKKMGMKSIWIQHPNHLTTSTDQFHPEITITHIDQLYNWLKTRPIS